MAPRIQGPLTCPRSQNNRHIPQTLTLNATMRICVTRAITDEFSILRSLRWVGQIEVIT